MHIWKKPLLRQGLFSLELGAKLDFSRACSKLIREFDICRKGDIVMPNRAAWAEIDLKALRHNYGEIKKNIKNGIYGLPKR